MARRRETDKIVIDMYGDIGSAFADDSRAIGMRVRLGAFLYQVKYTIHLISISVPLVPDGIPFVLRRSGERQSTRTLLGI